MAQAAQQGHRARGGRAVAVIGTFALVTAATPTVAAASGADDPRVGLPPDGEAALNLDKLSSSPLPEGFENLNSDLAFSGDHVFSGNYNGFNVYDVSNPADPDLVTSFLCPGSQNDVSVHGDLLFLSVEQRSARVDCSTDPEAEVFRGVRIVDVSDLAQPRLVANVQTCRGSHTHTLVEDPDDPETLYVYVSGTAGVRDAEQLATCSDGDATTEDPSRWRIDVIEVPLAAPQDAQVVGNPRLFADPGTGAVDGLQNEPPTPQHPSGSNWGPTPITDACHDITAYPELGLAAGACEGNGILVDITDPANPVRVTEVSDPNFAYWHSATFNNDGTSVVFTDEWGGGGGARCRSSDRPEWGANAIFDVVRDDAGVRLEFASYYKLPAVQTEIENCVAHNGSLVPVPGRDILVQAWYQGGTSVIDFTDTANPVEIAYFDRGPFLRADGSPFIAGYWSSYWHNGRVYGNEIGRGFDTFALLPSEHLTEVEIAAAEQVVLGDSNVQAQERVTWPATFTTVRAWQSAVQRQDELSPALDRTVTRLVDLAERLEARGLDRAASAVLRAATFLVGDSPVEQGLEQSLLDLADTVR